MILLRILRCAAAALLAAAGFVAAQPVRADESPGARLTPEQRRELWMRMTPEQREAMRERWMRERRRRMHEEQGLHIGEGMPHRLTAEERQRLRDQIREANREWRGKGGHGRRGER